MGPLVWYGGVSGSEEIRHTQIVVAALSKISEVVTNGVTLHLFVIKGIM